MVSLVICLFYVLNMQKVVEYMIPDDWKLIC